VTHHLFKRVHDAGGVIAGGEMQDLAAWPATSLAQGVERIGCEVNRDGVHQRAP